MKESICILLLHTVVALSGCNRSNDSIPLKHQWSPSKRFLLTFGGEQIGSQIFPKIIYLEDESGGRTIFNPLDPTSIEQSAFTFKPVWSSNGEWLLLPYGRFDGFVAFRERELPAAFSDKTKIHHIGACDINGTKWWHEFTEWTSSSAFRFKAGLSGQLFAFEYNIASGEIISIEKDKIAFRKLQ